MYDGPSFIAEIFSVLEADDVLRKTSQIKPFATGMRMGEGYAEFVLKPQSLLQLWYVLEICVRHDKIILMQAANTGVTAGSTPDGDDYDRDIVIISTLAIDQTVLINDGRQVLAYAGSTLYELEDKLDSIGRSPHSVIGSSCIGASVVGGVCNNSGGSLLNRGPAYTELSLFAQVDSGGRLRLVNELGGSLQSELGSTPVEILSNLDQLNYSKSNIRDDNKNASARDYQQKVRDINAATPARYNADPERLHQSSGCAGKLAVFAVRLDTFAKPMQEKVFYIGTDQTKDLNTIRRSVLANFKSLPEMGEYMHQNYFDAANDYCKDTYLIIKRLGTRYLTRIWSLNTKLDAFFARLKIFPERFPDRVSLFIAKLLPDHLPTRIRSYRQQFEHHLIIKATDDNISEMRKLMDSLTLQADFSASYFECSDREAEAALLHRFVAGGAISRYASFHKHSVAGVMPLDISLRRNDDAWHELLDLLQPHEAMPLVLSHFFCNVFHLDYIVYNNGQQSDVVERLKQQVLSKLDQRGAKYPAEHNVGHYYDAEASHKKFYQSLDPLNSFNAGVGKMSKKKRYQ